MIKLVVSMGIMCENYEVPEVMICTLKTIVITHAEQTNNCEAAGSPRSLSKGGNNKN
jgi:hypothetical protein